MNKIDAERLYGATARLAHLIRWSDSVDLWDLQHYCQETADLLEDIARALLEESVWSPEECE